MSPASVSRSLGWNGKNPVQYTQISRKTSPPAGTPFEVSVGTEYVSPTCEGF